MITSTKNYTKTKNKQKIRTDRTLGQMVKAKLYRQNHTKKHTHTHSQKEKKEKKICIFWEVWGLLPAFSRCSVGVVPHVDVFLMYLWGGRWSPHLTPPPSWRSLYTYVSGSAFQDLCITRLRKEGKILHCPFLSKSRLLWIWFWGAHGLLILLLPGTAISFSMKSFYVCVSLISIWKFSSHRSFWCHTIWRSSVR